MGNGMHAPLQTTPELAFCNQDVVRTLKAMLEIAERGEIGYLALVMAAAPNNLKVAVAGAQQLEWLALLGLKQVYKSLKFEERNRTPPRRMAELDASYVCYNMPGLAFSYDFVNWVVDAKMTQRREGAEGVLKVGFWPGRDGHCKALERFESCRQMLDHVMRPMLPLIGAVENDDACNGRVKEFAAMADIVAGARAGETVPKFGASNAARIEVGAWLIKNGTRAKDYVTITLREAQSWPHRNSNIEAWLKFARYAEKAGRRVIIVRDTATWMADPIGPYLECPMASLGLDQRCALYEQAFANLFVSNGPCNFAYFMDAPFLTFINVQPDGHAYQPDTPSWWLTRNGIEVGEQLPWFSERQRIVWGKDDYPKILRAWGEVFE